MIVVTANHFLADAVLGAMVAAVSALLGGLARARPAEAWRFGRRGRADGVAPAAAARAAAD